jgi:anti-anti-sigma factor
MAEGWFSNRTVAEAAVIEVVGEVDVANVSQFADELERASNSGCSTIVVSFERATYIDSATVNALLHSADRLREKGQRLAVAMPSDNRCGRIFRLIGLDKLLPIKESVSEAALAEKP